MVTSLGIAPPGGKWLIAIGSFTVPSSGTFLIRVRGTGTFGEDITTAPYEFFIQR
jgi:hypothetical protein